MAVNSFKSNALKPTPTELRQLPLSARLMRLLPIYGLVILTALLALFFSLVLPATFPTMLNARSIISDKSIIAILSLAAMIPMVTGKIDLTIGYEIVLWHILVISLQEWFGVPWPAAIVVVLCLGGLVGLFNGLLVELAQIDSFIATLGTGTVLYAIAMWHSQGTGSWAPFRRLHRGQQCAAPGSADHRLLCPRAVVRPLVHPRISADRPVSLCDWREPEGGGVQRYSRAPLYRARLRRLRGADGGCGRDARLQAQVGQASVGLEFLLPALVGVFLGSTTIKPGRFNVWGTLIGVVILAIGISGIQQLGGEFWVEPFFNGATLILAIGIAGYTQRRRVSGPRIEQVPTIRDAVSPRRPQGGKTA